MVKDTFSAYFSGGRGSRLHELTDKRAKPALYFGGNRRIIDFALSNCINSGLNRIGVVTQYAAHSLLRHLQTGWSFLPQERGEFVDMLPARQQIDDSNLVSWYSGCGISKHGDYSQSLSSKIHFDPCGRPYL